MEVLIVGTETAPGAGPIGGVTRAGSADAARALLRKGLFDCVVVSETDLQQLDIEGQRLPPIVRLLDSPNADRVSAAISLGADEVLRSDCTAEQLLHAVLNAVARRKRDSGLLRTFEELERLATIDPLTGLLNRRGVESAMAGV